MVTVDGLLPCIQNKWGEKRLTFTAANGSELWVLLLEKVWAKVHGDYCRIIEGLPHETMRDITGAPSYMYQTGKGEVSWEMIRKATKNNHMLAGGAAG